MTGAIFIVMILVDDKVEVEGGDKGGGKDIGGWTDDKKGDENKYGLKKVMMENKAGVGVVCLFQKLKKIFDIFLTKILLSLARLR